jgi:murein L,D-transpeptidase YcbB/YkuD
MTRGLPVIRRRRVIESETCMAFLFPRFSKNDRLAKVTSDRPLARSEKGRAVEIVQQCLVELGFHLPLSTQKSGLMDGIFGIETEEAVKQFQKTQGLVADGMVGPLTLAKLDAIYVQQEQSNRMALRAQVADNSLFSRWYVT